MTALWEVIEREGLPMALYTDRASWAAVTLTKGAKVDKTRRTQVGRALERLGVEHILAYSAPARGRSERMNGTLQGRVVNELRVQRISTVADANRYLREKYLPLHNAEFHRAPADPASAFVSLGATDLNQILCHEEERTVDRANTVVLDGVRLQIAKQPGRTTCAQLTVFVRRHLDGTHSVWWGQRCLGRYDTHGIVSTPSSSAAKPPAPSLRRAPPKGPLRPPPTLKRVAK